MRDHIGQLEGGADLDQPRRDALNDAPLAGNSGAAVAHQLMAQWAEGARRNGKTAQPDPAQPNRADWRAGRVRVKSGQPSTQARVSGRARKAIAASGDVGLAKHARVLLPSAREIFAVRIVNQEGETRPWPTGFTRDDLQRRLQRAGLR